MGDFPRKMEVKGVGMPEKRKWERWLPEWDRLLLEFVERRKGWPLSRVFREFAKETDFPYWGVWYRWKSLREKGVKLPMPERRKGQRWLPEQDRFLLEFAEQRKGWPLRRIFREFAQEAGLSFWAVKERWYKLRGLRSAGAGNGFGGHDGAAGGAAAPGFSGDGAEIKAALLELGRVPGREGRLNAQDLESVAGRFGVSYATVLAYWGQIWAAGDVQFPTREELAGELRQAKGRVAVLEEEVASLRAGLEEALEARRVLESEVVALRKEVEEALGAKRRLEALLADLRRLVA